MLLVPLENSQSLALCHKIKLAMLSRSMVQSYTNARELADIAHCGAHIDV